MPDSRFIIAPTYLSTPFKKEEKPKYLSTSRELEGHTPPESAPKNQLKSGIQFSESRECVLETNHPKNFFKAEKTKSSKNTKIIKEEREEESQQIIITSRHRRTENKTQLVSREIKLEKNRQAAAKYRNAQKEKLHQQIVEFEALRRENESLSQTVDELKNEISNIKMVMMVHQNCDK